MFWICQALRRCQPSDLNDIPLYPIDKYRHFGGDNILVPSIAALDEDLCKYLLVFEQQRLRFGELFGLES